MTHTLVTDPHSIADDTPAGIENANDAPVSDSVSDVPRETDAPDAPDADTDVPRETAADDGSRETLGIESHVTDAVESAVSQWVGFDPEIHAVNPDGTPKLRANGSYALKRGRKRGGTFPAPGTDHATAGNPDPGADTVQATPPVTSAPQVAAATLNNAQTALFLVTSVTGVLSRAIGPEWTAEKSEVKGLSDATKAYLDATGGLNLSPGIALSLAIASYAAPRFAHENTRSRFGRIYDWCRDRFAVIRNRIGV